jgi:MerR family transcriptional regulator, thiopeptide resistance regulator
MAFTVKQISDLAGVSARTLHFYDQIDLLKPGRQTANGYRVYTEANLLRLQQILFFKELDFSLEEIKEIMDQPGFDMLSALEAHAVALQERVSRMNRLIHTVEKTISYIKGNTAMNDKEIFEGFSEEKQAHYEEEIRQRYGKKAFEGVTDWNSYTPEQKAQIMAEGEAVYQRLAAHRIEGPQSPAVQAELAHWHQHLRYFYEPSIDRLEGLGHLYNEHPDFQATFRKIHPDFPAFLEQAIIHYTETLRKK